MLECNSAKSFDREDYAIKSRIGASLWKSQLLKRSILEWLAYVDESLKIKDQKMGMLLRAAKRRLKLWHIRTEVHLARRERHQIAKGMGANIIKRLNFRRWRIVAKQGKFIQVSLSGTDSIIKNQAAALGKLRYGYYRWHARLLLLRWDDEAKFLARMEWAYKYHKARFKDTYFRAFKAQVLTMIIVKNKVRGGSSDCVVRLCRPTWRPCLFRLIISTSPHYLTPPFTSNSHLQFTPFLITH
jgi:hypothetical protein